MFSALMPAAFAAAGAADDTSMPWAPAHEQKLCHPVAYVLSVLGDSAAAFARATSRSRSPWGLLLIAHRHGGQSHIALLSPAGFV